MEPYIMCSAFPVHIALSNFWFVLLYLKADACYRLQPYNTTLHNPTCSQRLRSLAESFQPVLYMPVFWSFSLMKHKAVYFDLILSAACHTTWTLCLVPGDSFQLKSERRNTVEQTVTSKKTSPLQYFDLTSMSLRPP